MGEYLVNGQVVDVRDPNPTAGDLKLRTGAVSTDWVMANMPSGEVVKVADGQPLPAGVDDFSVIPQFTYGAPGRGTASA